MFKAVIEMLIVVILVLVLITQVMIPMFIPSLDMFWVFKKQKNKEIPSTPVQKDLDGTIDEVANELEENAGKFKSTLNKVDSTISKLNEVKTKSTNNLNN